MTRDRAAAALMVAAGTAALVWVFRDVIAPTIDVEHARTIIRQLSPEIEPRFGEHGALWDEADVLALIDVESDFNPKATRWEPSVNEASMGLMQTLVSTARDRGFTGAPEDLYVPETSIYYGLRHLRWIHASLLSKTGHWATEEEWLTAYNMGVGAAVAGKRASAYIANWRAARAKYQSTKVLK